MGVIGASVKEIFPADGRPGVESPPYERGPFCTPIPGPGSVPIDSRRTVGEHTLLPAARDLTARVASRIARLDAKMTLRSGDGKALFPRYRPVLPND
jgi:hypothetical protein